VLSLQKASEDTPTAAQKASAASRGVTGLGTLF
jgi:hypothetical protein